MGSILNWYGSAFCWHGNAWDRCTIRASLGLLAERSSLVSIPNTRFSKNFLLTWFGSTWVEFYMMEIFEKSFCTVVKWKFLNLIPLEFFKYIDSPQRRLKKPNDLSKFSQVTRQLEMESILSHVNSTDRTQNGVDGKRGKFNMLAWWKDAKLFFCSFQFSLFGRGRAVEWKIPMENILY